MTTYKVTATAPTSYQLNSLRAFGITPIKYPTGAYQAEEIFYSEEDAKDYLKERAEMYNDGDPNGSDEKLAEMYNDIDRLGHLTLDAVTAYIEEVEEEEEEDEQE